MCKMTYHNTNIRYGSFIQVGSNVVTGLCPRGVEKSGQHPMSNLEAHKRGSGL